MSKYFVKNSPTSGLDSAIQILLPPLKIEDLNKYSKYKSFLYGARFYEFSKAYHMYLDIKEKIAADCGTAIGKHGIFRVLPEDVKIGGKSIIHKTTIILFLFLSRVMFYQ